MSANSTPQPRPRLEQRRANQAAAAASAPIAAPQAAPAAQDAAEPAQAIQAAAAPKSEPTKPHEYFKKAAPKLARLGYEVLPAHGKRLLIEGWTHIPLPVSQIDAWAANGEAASNVSIRTGTGPVPVIAIDIDILAPDVAAAVARSAIDHFGPAPRRVGKDPKCALIYRTQGPFPKLNSPKWKSPGGSGHKVEVLATGQQFVAYGLHPDTGKEYRWIGEPLSRFEPWELAPVSADAVEAWMRDVVPTLIPGDWTIVQAASRVRELDGEADPFPTLKCDGITLDDLRFMLANLPAECCDDYDEWRDVVFAVHHQYSGTDEEQEARDIVDEWSQQSVSYEVGCVEKVWGSANTERAGNTRTLRSVIKILGEKWAAYRRTKAGAPPEPTKDERIASKSRWTELISTTDCPIDLENSVMPQIAADQALAESQRGMLADELVRRFAQLTPSNRSPFTVTEIKKRIKRIVQARAATDRPDDNWMFEDLAVVRVGGKVAVLMVRETEEPGNEAPVITMTPADTSLYFRDQTVMRYDPEKDKVAPTSMYDEWVSHPAATRYRGIEFEPGGGRAGFYNIWRGFGLTPVAGDCGLFLAHIRDVICAGNTEHFDWLIGWLADLVQNPGRKPGTAVVLRGGEGAGKGKAFADQLRDIVGARLYRKVSRVEQLIGKFNAHLAGALLIFANESLWGGDPSKEGALKDLITEDRQRIEPKGIDSFEISDYARLLFATNEGWAVPAGHDARRFFVLDVSNSRQGDAGYFKALYAELNNGGRSAFLHHLMNVDLTGFNVHRAPKTAGLLDLKLRRLPTPERWLFDLLHSRGEADSKDSSQDAWPETWPCAVMHDVYTEYARKVFDRHPMNCNQFGKWLAGRIPGVTVGRKNKEKRHYKLPTLGESRKAFEKFIGHTIEWDSDAVTDDEGAASRSEAAPDGFDLAGTPD